MYLQYPNEGYVGHLFRYALSTLSLFWVRSRNGALRPDDACSLSGSGFAAAAVLPRDRPGVDFIGTFGGVGGRCRVPHSLICALIWAVLVPLSRAYLGSFRVSFRGP